MADIAAVVDRKKKTGCLFGSDSVLTELEDRVRFPLLSSSSSGLAISVAIFVAILKNRADFYAVFHWLIIG